jgi:hypothetical protein
MKFATNNKTCINLNIGYDDKTTEEVLTTQFLGLQTDNNTIYFYKSIFLFIYESYFIIIMYQF